MRLFVAHLSCVQLPTPFSVSSYQILSSDTPSAPPTIVQPKVQILKRPSSAASNASNASGASTTEGKTLAQREREYKEARERIFGNQSPAVANGVRIARTPISPSEEGERGFGARRAPPTTVIPQSSNASPATARPPSPLFAASVEPLRLPETKGQLI